MLGSRADAIAAMAVRGRCPIVMGSRGHSTLNGMVFGLFGAQPQFHLIHVLPDPASPLGARLPYQPAPAEKPAQIGYGRLKSLVLGSVAMRVAGRCDKPLLLVRER